jgi:hypothetical protein
MRACGNLGIARTMRCCASVGVPIRETCAGDRLVAGTRFARHERDACLLELDGSR